MLSKLSQFLLNHTILSISDNWCQFTFSTFDILSITSGVGNCFPSRATLRLYKCQISVKNANFKLKIWSLRAGCGTRVVCCPLRYYILNLKNILKILFQFLFFHIFSLCDLYNFSHELAKPYLQKHASNNCHTIN